MFTEYVDPAVPPQKPVSPKIPLNLTLGVLLGLALGIGWVFVLDYLDRSIKSPEDLEKRGLNVLGSIPLMAGTNMAGKGSETEQKVMKDGTIVHTLIHHKHPTRYRKLTVCSGLQSSILESTNRSRLCS